MSTDTTDIVIDMTQTQAAAPQEATAIIHEDSPVIVVDEHADLGDPLPDAATLNDDGSITLVLRRPVSVLRRSERGEKREEITELTFNRLNGADMRAVGAVSGVNAQIVLLAKSSRMREAVMGKVYDAMDAADIVDAGTCVERFFGSGPKTGR